MSVLLVSVDRELGGVLIARLLAADDQVRVIENEPAHAAWWRALGAFVAQGEMDADLIERAAQNVRTIVIGERAGPPTDEVMNAVIEGGRTAGVDRVVLSSADPPAPWLDALRISGLQFVVLKIAGPRRRFSARRKLIPVEATARAIDAADDIAGEPRLELDLTRPGSWAELGLRPPGA